MTRPTPAEEGMKAARTDNAMERWVGSLVTAKTPDGLVLGEIVAWHVAGGAYYLILAAHDGKHWICDDEITAVEGTAIRSDGSRVICWVPVNA